MPVNNLKVDGLGITWFRVAHGLKSGSAEALRTPFSLNNLAPAELERLAMRVFRACCLGLVLITALIAGPVRAADLGGRLKRLFSEYKRIESVRLTSRAIIDFNDSLAQRKPGLKGRHIEARYSYVAKGSKYRIVSRWNRATPDMDWEVAWDGRRFLELDRRTHTMQVIPHNTHQSVELLRNPLLTPLTFLSIGGMRHGGWGLRLHWVQQQTIEQRAIRLARWSHGRRGAAATFPGRIYYWKIPFKFRVRFERRIPFLPACIERVAENGVVLDRIDFVKYKKIPLGDGKVFYAPWRFKRQWELPHRGLVFHTEIDRITRCAINQLIPPGSFTISFREAKSIYDVGAKRFIVPPDSYGRWMHGQKAAMAAKTSFGFSPPAAKAGVPPSAKRARRSIVFWGWIGAIAVLCLGLLFLWAPWSRGGRSSS